MTSWKIDESSINLAVAGGAGGAHVVLVVDHSGSMRKNDVANYTSGTAAVYDCLARDFVEAQLHSKITGNVTANVTEGCSP